MLIGIDAHNLEGKRTGVGRYLLNLLKIWSKMDFRQFYHTTEYDRIGKNKINEIKFILYFKSDIPADLRPAPTVSPSDVPEGESKRGWLNLDLFESKLLNVKSTAKFMNWDLGRAAKKDKVDILFCPDYRAPIGYQGKTAITLHDISYEVRPEDFNWPSLADKILLKWASKKTAKKAKVIFAPSEFTRGEIIKYYDISPEKVILTPLSVDPALLVLPSDAGNKTAAVKEKYGIRGDFALFVGSIFSRRHLPEIIGAFEQLCLADRNSFYDDLTPQPPFTRGAEMGSVVVRGAEKGTILTKGVAELQLLIGGKDYTAGKAVDNLVRTVNDRLGRETILRVDFIGDDELKLLYGACAFFIWLSDYEGFGLPPLEAMSLGAPVITTDGSSLREAAGNAALLIRDNYDVKEIYRAARKLTRDGVLRDNLIARGREQAKKFFWKNCAKKTLRALSGS